MSAPSLYVSLYEFAQSSGDPALLEALTELTRASLTFPTSSLVMELEALPPNLSDMTPDDLGLHLSQWAGASAYGWTLYAAAVAIKDAASDTYDRAYATAMLRQRQVIVKGNATIWKAGALLDPRVAAALALLRKTETMVRMIDKLSQSFDKNYQAVSRQVSIVDNQRQGRQT